MHKDLVIGCVRLYIFVAKDMESAKKMRMACCCDSSMVISQNPDKDPMRDKHDESENSEMNPKLEFCFIFAPIRFGRSSFLLKADVQGRNGRYRDFHRESCRPPKLMLGRHYRHRTRLRSGVDSSALTDYTIR